MPKQRRPAEVTIIIQTNLSCACSLAYILWSGSLPQSALVAPTGLTVASEVPSSSQITVINYHLSSCPGYRVWFVRAVENCAADSSGADPHDRDVLFEDARIHCLAADIHVWLDKMEKPVNFDYVRFTSDGRAYFQDPDCPGWIQVVENHVWTSKSVSLAKMGILGEEMKRIVEEAEILLSSNQSGTATPAPSQNPTLPSLPSHHAKISSRPPSHESVGKRKAPQRRLLPSSHSSSSISTRKRPLFQAPNEQTQALQSTSSCWYLNDDFYSVRLNNF